MGEQLLGVGEVVVDDLSDALDVQASRRHVGGDQDRRDPRTEVLHHPLAGDLAEIALQGADGITRLIQLPGQSFDTVLGLAEHEDRRAVPAVQQDAQRLHLVGLLDAVNQVFHGGQGFQIGVHGHGDRVVEVLPGGLRHPVRHGGRKQRGLPLGRSLAQDGVDVAGEASIEHLVGFVQHQKSH